MSKNEERREKLLDEQARLKKKLQLDYEQKRRQYADQAGDMQILHEILKRQDADRAAAEQRQWERNNQSRNR